MRPSAPPRGGDELSESRESKKMAIHPEDRDWSGPQGDDPRTLNELLTKAVGRNQGELMFGTIPAPGAPRIHLTYDEFGQLVDSCARSLRDSGVGLGDRVALIIDNSVEWAAAAYATNALGAAYTAMYTHQHGAEWAYILGDSEPTILVAANTDVLDNLCEHLPADGWPAAGIVLLGDDVPNASPPEGVPVRPWTRVRCEIPGVI